MKATVLPEKQLRYVLQKQGLIDLNNNMQFANKYFKVYFSTYNFKDCLKEIEISPRESWIDPFYSYRRYMNDYWHKEWFVPNSFKDN